MNDKQRVLVLMHPDLIPPESNEGFSEQEASNWKTEYDVVSTLRAAGHEVRPLGVHDELKIFLRQVCNLLTQRNDFGSVSGRMDRLSA